MGNDATINPLSSSDSSIAPLRKKPHSESISVNKLSFFDELLGIGQFESIVPDAIGPSRESRISTDRSDEDSPKSQPEDSIDASESKPDLGPQSSQPQLLVPLTQQLQSPDLEKTTEIQPTEGKPSTEHQTRVTPGEKSAVASDAKTEETGKVESKNHLQNGTKGPLAPNNSPNPSPVAVGDSTVSSLGQNLTESEEAAQSSAPVESSNLKPIPKSGNSPQSSNADTNGLKSEQGKPQPVSRPDYSEDANESQNHLSDQNNAEANRSRPRNKRAEHLAQRASESAPIANSLDPSTRSSQATESTPPKGNNDAPANPSLTSTASLPSNSSPATSVSPIIATPTAFTSGVTNTSTSTSVRPNAEAISAIGTATTRGGIQTNTSNTSYTGAVSNPGRPEQARGEVARSNSGTQISAYQEVKLVQRVLRGVEQLANGGGQVRLRLHPPELGALQMSLRMEAGQVFARLEVENSTARDALLNNVQTLKDRMAEQGMNVAAFEVEVSTDSSGSGTDGSNMHKDGGSGSQSRWENATSRFAQQNNNRLSVEPGQADSMPGAAWTRTNGSLDLTV